MVHKATGPRRHSILSELHTTPCSPYLTRRALLTRTLFHLLLTFGVMLCIATPSHYANAYDIRVRGEGRLFVDVQSAGTALQVTGALRDELGDSLLQRAVEIEIFSSFSGRSLVSAGVITDMQGRFQWQRSFEEGDYDVVVTFPSTDHLDGIEARATVELRSVPPRIDIRAPEVVIGSTHPASLMVRASAGGVGVAGAPVDISVGSREVLTLELDAYGRGVADLSGQLSPGINRVTARMQRTARRDEASDSTRLFYAPSAQLRATLEASVHRLERGLHLTGEVVSGTTPIPGGALLVRFERTGELEGVDEASSSRRGVGAEQNKLRPVEVGVDEEGTFEAFLPGVDIADGRWVATLVWRADVGDPVTLTTEEVMLDRTGSRWFLDLLSILAAIVGLAALFYRLTTLDMRAILSSWRARRHKKSTPDEDDEGLDVPLHIESLSIPEEIASEPQEERFWRVAGIVWDVWRRVPLPAAVIEVGRREEAAQGVHHVEVDAEGHFALPKLDAGAWILRAHAPGYVRSEVEFEIPHSGDLRYIRLGLTPVALRIRRYYQRWVARVHGEDVWGRLSPRQIEGAIRGALDTVAPSQGEGVLAGRRASLRQRMDDFFSDTAHIGSLSPDDLLLSVTHIIEEVYYSSRDYDEESWHLVVEMLRRIEETITADSSAHEVSP